MRLQGEDGNIYRIDSVPPPEHDVSDMRTTGRRKTVRGQLSTLYTDEGDIVSPREDGRYNILKPSGTVIAHEID